MNRTLRSELKRLNNEHAPQLVFSEFVKIYEKWREETAPEFIQYLWTFIKLKNNDVKPID